MYRRVDDLFRFPQLGGHVTQATRLIRGDELLRIFEACRGSEERSENPLLVPGWCILCELLKGPRTVILTT